MVFKREKFPEKNKKDEKITDNAFEEAKKLASKGQTPKITIGSSKKSSEKAKDDLFRAKEANKEWSNESDHYRRDD